MLIKRGNAEIVSVIDAPEMLDEEAKKLTKAAQKELNTKDSKSLKDSKLLEN